MEIDATLSPALSPDSGSTTHGQVRVCETVLALCLGGRNLGVGTVLGGEERQLLLHPHDLAQLRLHCERHRQGPALRQQGQQVLQALLGAGEGTRGNRIS